MSTAFSSSLSHSPSHHPSNPYNNRHCALSLFTMPNTNPSTTSTRTYTAIPPHKVPPAQANGGQSTAAEQITRQSDDTAARSGSRSFPHGTLLYEKTLRQLGGSTSVKGHNSEQTKGSKDLYKACKGDDRLDEVHDSDTCDLCNQWIAEEVSSNK